MALSTHTKVKADIAGLARTHSESLRRYFERRVFRHADIDDLVQEVFLRLARRGDLNDISHIEGYLFETAANILRDRARHNITHMASAHQELSLYHEEATAFSPERILIGRDAFHLDI